MANDEKYTHEDAWNDMKSYMERGMVSLKQLAVRAPGDEKTRLHAKLDGVKTCYQYLCDTERLYLEEGDDEGQIRGEKAYTTVVSRT